MDPIKLDVNKTTTFLLPMLFPNSTHDEIFSNYFKQAYIGLLDDEMPTSSIVLEFDEDSITLDLIDDFISNFQPQGDITDMKDNLLFFNILDHAQEDYEKFLKGNYSEVRDEFKQTILDFWKENDSITLLYGILYNNNDNTIKGLKKQPSGENWPPPDLFEDEFLVP